MLSLRRSSGSQTSLTLSSRWRQSEPDRHHANHRVRLAVEHDRFANDRGIAAIAATPERLAQDDHAAAVGNVARGEHSADGVRAGKLAERRQDGRDVNAGGWAIAVLSGAVLVHVGLECLERSGILLPGPNELHFGQDHDAHAGGVAARRLEIHERHAVRIRVRQRMQQQRVDDAEHGGVGPNTQRQRDDRNGSPALLPVLAFARRT